MEKRYLEKVEESKKFLEAKISTPPSVMLILSGGLSKFVEKISDPVVISAADIPNFPGTRVEGHSGKIIFGKIGSLPIVAFQGRFHYYEGHKPSDIIFPTFVMNALGAKMLVVTNAVGGINENFETGDLMLITDHINYMGMNPLVGVTVERPDNQFPDMTEAYTERLQKIARDAAKSEKIELKEGVFIATSGPSYETKTETRMFKEWGADAVGMSVVPEIIAANYLGMETLGLSCIANVASYRHEGKMTHSAVLSAMKEMEDRLVKLLLAIVKKI